MKKLLWVFVIVVSAYGLAFGQEIPYTYRIVNRPSLVDIDIHGDLLARVGLSGNVAGLLVGRKAKMLPVEFRCGNLNDETEARRINNHSSVAGSCEAGLLNNKSVGFVRDKKGGITFVDVPNSTQTELYAIGDNDETCGLYYTAFDPGQSGFTRIHGFCHSKVYRTIDVPVANSVTVMTGTSRSGKKLGNYFVYDPATNETGPWHCFEYDNGIFTSLERPGAAWSYCSDMTNHDVVLYEDDKDVFVLDDGIYFTISQPTPDPGWTLQGQVDVEGFNDALEIVGRFTQGQSCIELFCPRQVKNFVATPG